MGSGHAKIAAQPPPGSFEVQASADQLDTIVDAIDDLLAEHEESAFEVEGETYQTPLG